MSSVDTLPSSSAAPPTAPTASAAEVTEAGPSLRESTEPSARFALATPPGAMFLLWIGFGLARAALSARSAMWRARRARRSTSVLAAAEGAETTSRMPQMSRARRARDMIAPGNRPSPATLEPDPPSGAAQRVLSSADSAKPSVVTTPVSGERPSASNASGIIVSASMVRIAPAANDWMNATQFPEASPSTA